jgi:hypothetical protein
MFLLSDQGFWTSTHPSSDGHAVPLEIERND